mmetsp:Transcript_18430/g.51679  ORF Transcript_18430/g.51679 Transcript_18430/m.51679 type:complete len:207 (-) Transcript_18430:799-1419(-)
MLPDAPLPLLRRGGGGRGLCLAPGACSTSGAAVLRRCCSAHASTSAATHCASASLSLLQVGAFLTRASAAPSAPSSALVVCRARRTSGGLRVPLCLRSPRGWRGALKLRRCCCFCRGRGRPKRSKCCCSWSCKEGGVTARKGPGGLRICEAVILVDQLLAGGMGRGGDMANLDGVLGERDVMDGMGRGEGRGMSFRGAGLGKQEAL